MATFSLLGFPLAASSPHPDLGFRLPPPSPPNLLGLLTRRHRTAEGLPRAGAAVRQRARPARSSPAAAAGAFSRSTTPSTTSRSSGCKNPSAHRSHAWERVYDIRDDNLEGKYKDWQKKLHPDLVHSKSEKEKAFAAEQSARVIDAFHTLSKPLSRALYLLQLEGVHVDEEKTVEDHDLLAEMMEIREEVEEANSSEALNQIQAQMQRKLEAWSNSFLEAFKKRDFEDAVTSTQRMRYYERAIEAIVEKL